MYELKAYAYTMASLVVGLICFRYCADRRLNAAIGKRLLPLMLVAQAAAFLSPNVIVYNIVAGLALVVCCGERRSIAPSYLFLLTSLPPAGKIVAAGGTYLMAFDVTISLGIAALVALAVRSKGRFSRSMIWDVPVVLLFLLFLVANARATTATNTMRIALEQASTFLLPYFIISRSLRSFDDLRDALYGLVAAVMAMSALAIYEALHTWPLYRIVADHYGIILSGDASVKVRAGFLRSPGPYTEPTSFSLCLAIGMLAAIGCPRMFASKDRRSTALAIMTIGILAPQSRGGWVGIAIGLAAMHVYEGRYAALAKKVGIAALGMLAVFAAAQVDTRIASAAGLNAEGQGTVEYRSNLLDRGLETIRANPVFGSTFAQVRYEMRDMTQGEGIIDFVNTYLFVALISGLVGLAVFVTALVWPVVMVWLAKDRVPRQDRRMFLNQSSAALIFGTLAACIVMIAFTSMVGRTTMLIAIYIGFVSAILNIMRATRRGVKGQPAAAAPMPAELMLPEGV